MVTKEKEALIKFGKRLTQLRKSKKLSFRKLAALCETDYSDIRKYEKGLKDLRFLTIIDLASGLEVHPRELWDFEFGVTLHNQIKTNKKPRKTRSK